MISHSFALKTFYLDATDCATVSADGSSKDV